jgi:putative transposase
MKRRFTDEQIIGVLKEHEAGLSAKELCRKYGMSDATFYKWKAKFSGMEVNEAHRACSLLVGTNESAITDNIGHEYRSKTAFDALLDHLVGPDP